MRRVFLLVFLLGACGDEREPIPATGVIVFIGDSITQEWAIEKFVEGAVNAGESGEESAQMLTRFERDVLARDPALVVIHGGINDIRNRESTDIGSILAMVQLAQAGDVRVVVGTVLDATNLGANAGVKRQLIRVMNADLHAAAGAFGFALVDYHAASSAQSGRRGVLRDGLHPSRAGYLAMWRALLPILRDEGVVADPAG